MTNVHRPLLLAAFYFAQQCMGKGLQDNVSPTVDNAESILARLNNEQPLAVRKMTDFEGEMFQLQYWAFDTYFSRATTSDRESTGNDTAMSLRPPILRHDSVEGLPAWRSAARVFKRAFQCPSGTFACTSINQPNSCCPTGENCISVVDTGLGPVGCCPSGQSCAGMVAQCNTAAGYTSCPGSPNGGCCIPGFRCQGVGCIAVGTTVLVTSSRTASSATSVSTSTNPPQATVPPSTSVRTITSTVVISSSSLASPTTVVVTQTLTVSPSSSGTVSAVAPVRPTSDSSISSPVATASPTSATPATTAPASTAAGTDGCPTNFYRCLAFYVGGCCRVGRDCNSTSCPPLTSTTTAADAGGTVVNRACASGWQTCAASLGGGCCPGGYACGSATCTATQAGQSGVSQVLSTSSAKARVAGQATWLVYTSIVGILFVLFS